MSQEQENYEAGEHLTYSQDKSYKCPCAKTFPLLTLVIDQNYFHTSTTYPFAQAKSVSDNEEPKSIDNNDDSDQKEIPSSDKEIRANRKTIVLSISIALLITIAGLIFLYKQSNGIQAQAPVTTITTTIVKDMVHRNKSKAKDSTKVQQPKVNNSKNKAALLPVSSSIVWFFITATWFFSLIIVVIRCQLQKRDSIPFLVIAFFFGLIFCNLSRNVFDSNFACVLMLGCVSLSLRLAALQAGIHIEVSSLFPFRKSKLAGKELDK